jgi:hypothetical protein
MATRGEPPPAKGSGRTTDVIAVPEGLSRERTSLAQARAALDKERAELAQLRLQVEAKRRRDEGKSPTASDPLEESWVVQGPGNFLSWCADDEDDDGPRAGGDPRLDRLAEAIVGRVGPRLEARLIAAIAAALHEALGRERESLKDQREALARTAAALEKQRQMIETKWEALRAAQGRIDEDTKAEGIIIQPPASPRPGSDRLPKPPSGRLPRRET